MKKIKVALFASGNGTNVQAIIQAAQEDVLPIDIQWLICDKPKAKVVQRAKHYHVPVWTFTHQSKGGRQKWEEEVCCLLKESQVDYIILAGYLRIIGETLLNAFPQKIMNIHPSLLPAFPGLNSIQAAYEYGVKVTGVTIHWIDKGVDTGPIIAQEALPIQSDWTLEDLENQIHAIEHQLYVQTIRQVITQEKG